MSTRTYFIVNKNYHANWFFNSKELVLQEGGCNSTQEQITKMFIYSEDGLYYEFFTGEYLGTVQSGSIYSILTSDELGEIGVTSHYYGSDNPDLFECSAASFQNAVKQYLPRRLDISRRIQTIFNKRKDEVEVKRQSESKAREIAQTNNENADQFLGSIIESHKNK